MPNVASLWTHALWTTGLVNTWWSIAASHVLLVSAKSDGHPRDLKETGLALVASRFLEVELRQPN